MTTFEIVLSGDHEDIFVIVEVPNVTSEKLLLETSIEEAMKNTVIWSKKLIDKTRE